MPRRVQKKTSALAPPSWFIVLMMVCVMAVLLALFLRLDAPGSQARAAATPTPEVTATPEPTPVPTPEPTPEPTPTPTPTPTPEPDWSLPIPEGEKVDPDAWFADAVFIGDSRTDGLHLYSGITPEADFLYSTGITVWDVMADNKVIRQGDKKLSILEALGQKQYGKVYIALGTNELGSGDPAPFIETYEQLIDAVREIQPDARLYVQSIIPVNTAKCQANNQRSYVTNENVAIYNEALTTICVDKKVPRLGVSEDMLDENGEVRRELSADGVHFKKEGYVLWLDYLTTHTGDPVSQ